MQTTIFQEYPNIYRESLVNFSSLFFQMIEELKQKLIQPNFFGLTMLLGRLTDSGFDIGPSINFFSTNLIGENTIEAMFCDNQHYDEQGEPIPQKKVIRLDNPLAELPVLPSYKNNTKFFVIGEELISYRQFIENARTNLLNVIGEDITLCYKNDDLSISMVSGTLKEVNKSNILMEDFHELLVRDNKTVRVDVIKREKNHRFISQNGYLFSITPSFFEKKQVYDDGEVFGDKEVWSFQIPSQIANIA